MANRRNRRMANMNNAELIAALRYCSVTNACDYGCPYWAKDGHCDLCKVTSDAADHIEAQQKRIAELEAQLPKEGEWKLGDEMPDYPRIPYKPWMRYCSVCGGMTGQDDNALFDYCPDCGARMKGEQE